MDALVPSCLRYRVSRQKGMNRAYTTNMSAEYMVWKCKSQNHLAIKRWWGMGRTGLINQSWCAHPPGFSTV